MNMMSFTIQSRRTLKEISGLQLIYPQSLLLRGLAGSMFQKVDIWMTQLLNYPRWRDFYEKSVSQIFIDNGLEYLLFAHGNDYEYDPIHINDIQPVNFDGKYWKKGDLFYQLEINHGLALSALI